MKKMRYSMFFFILRHASQWGILFLLLVLAGCAGPPERQPLPPEYTLKAGVPGIPEARFWGDEWPTFAAERFEEFTVADFQREYDGIYGKPHNYLAISGGGANGAFGAGLLVGWTESGERPEFTMVTGVSTGALIAPFAFLGPDYDGEMKTMYTTISTKDIARKRKLLAVLSNDSMADTAPLKALIAKVIDAEMIDAIAREHKKGRRLFIGTVNLDAGRSVIWNISAIAVSDYPQKITLIQDLLRASAAIPVAFPPVFITVEAEGKQYDEMHVDGGTGSQVFVYPAAVDWQVITRKLKVKGKPQVYVVRNSFLDADYNGVKRSVFPIASRTIDSLIRTQGVGDLYQIYTLCQRDGNDFNLAYIPSDFTDEPTEGFDPVYMKKLFDRGYQMSLEGYPWEKAPPGFILATE
ncbi:MAG: patatin-like phospholipase family protein [Xanthomonadales bacterium]|nr:patatin-like phospholipase family protein [Xanthomonadales bacterium]